MVPFNTVTDIYISSSVHRRGPKSTVAMSKPSVQIFNLLLNTILLMKAFRAFWESGCFQGWGRENMKLEHLQVSEKKKMLNKEWGAC